MQPRQRIPDPFFEQLQKDVAEGLAAADRGDVVDADEVWREYGVIDAAGNPIKPTRTGPLDSNL